MEFICSKTEPIVEIAKGKIHGFKQDGIYTFRGIKYATAKRFHKPVPTPAWDGVMEAIQYGATAPYMEEKPNGFNYIRIPHRYWPQKEDCLFLNVWTNTLDKSAKKPVMVWIHGGGFDTGSSVELPCYDGANAARYGDVVMVSLNHRLNIAGFLDLSQYGEEYKDSGCNGIMDIVTALQWVQDNIDAFGGDAGNVTIFGQSGGGGKCQVLLQTPAAAGLFHKAIIESGLSERPPYTPEASHRISELLIAQLGITPEHIAEIEDIPYSAICDAYHAILPQLQAENLPARGWYPVSGGYFPGNAWEVGLSEHAKKVKIMCGSCRGEFPSPYFPGHNHNLTDEQLDALFTKKFGPDAKQIISLYEKTYPGCNPVDAFNMDTHYRPSIIAYLDQYSEATENPIYNYMFTHEFDYNDGEPAWHCSELPLVFHNIEYAEVCHNEAGEKLQDMFFAAWTNFAKTGNPNNKYMPEWPAYTKDCKACMMIDLDCSVREDFDRELIDTASKALSGKPLF